MNPPTQVEAVKCECCEETYYDGEAKMCDICCEWKCPHCMGSAINSITQEKEANVCRLCLDEIEKINKADVKASQLDNVKTDLRIASDMANEMANDPDSLTHYKAGQLAGFLRGALNQVSE